MVRLPRNEKQAHRLNSRPQMWPSDSPLAKTLTMNFPGQMWNLLYFNQKWYDCHETKRKHIDLNSRPQMWPVGLTLAMTLMFEFSRSYVILTIWWPRSGVMIYQIVTGVRCTVNSFSLSLILFSVSNFFFFEFFPPEWCWPYVLISVLLPDTSQWCYSTCRDNGGHIVTLDTWSLSHSISHPIWTAQCKTAVTPLLTHWSYCSLVLSHRYAHGFVLLCFGVVISSGLMWFIYPYLSGLFHRHWGNQMITPVQVNSLRPSDPYMRQ